jgi:predicted RNA binding protein YcfA (HicA-like mRNA interferase family)
LTIRIKRRIKYEGNRAGQKIREAGWRVDRITGSHHIMQNPADPRLEISIPVHGARDVPKGILERILKGL